MFQSFDLALVHSTKWARKHNCMAGAAPGRWSRYSPNLLQIIPCLPFTSLETISS